MPPFSAASRLPGRTPALEPSTTALTALLAVADSGLNCGSVPTGVPSSSRAGPGQTPTLLPAGTAASGALELPAAAGALGRERRGGHEPSAGGDQDDGGEDPAQPAAGGRRFRPRRARRPGGWTRPAPRTGSPGGRGLRVGGRLRAPVARVSSLRHADVPYAGSLRPGTGRCWAGGRAWEWRAGRSGRSPRPARSRPRGPTALRSGWLNWPPCAGRVKAWAQPDVVEVRRRPSSQALQPGSARSASTTSRPSGPAGTAASADIASDGTSPTVAPAPSTIRTRWATSAALERGLVQRADPPQPADIGLADGDESGHGVHPAGRQLGGGVGERGAPRSRRRAARARAGDPRPGRPRGWPRRCGARPRRRRRRGRSPGPAAPMMLRAAAMVDRPSRVVPAPRISAASKRAVLAGADQQCAWTVPGPRRGRWPWPGGSADSAGCTSRGVPSAGPVGTSAGRAAAADRSTFWADQAARPALRGPARSARPAAGQQEDRGRDRRGADQDPAAGRGERRPGRRRQAGRSAPIRAAPRRAKPAAERPGR